MTQNAIDRALRKRRRTFVKPGHVLFAVDRENADILASPIRFEWAPKVYDTEDFGDFDRETLRCTTPGLESLEVIAVIPAADVHEFARLTGMAEDLTFTAVPDADTGTAWLPARRNRHGEVRIVETVPHAVPLRAIARSREMWETAIRLAESVGGGAA